jgi:hypothetical protein
MNQNRVELPEATVQLQQQLEQWRATQPVRTKLPQAFWQSAAETGQTARSEFHSEGAAAGLHRPQEKSFGMFEPAGEAGASGIHRTGWAGH